MQNEKEVNQVKQNDSSVYQAMSLSVVKNATQVCCVSAKQSHLLVVPLYQYNLHFEQILVIGLTSEKQFYICVTQAFTPK